MWKRDSQLLKVFCEAVFFIPGFCGPYGGFVVIVMGWVEFFSQSEDELIFSARSFFVAYKEFRFEFLHSERIEILDFGFVESECVFSKVDSYV